MQDEKTSGENRKHKDSLFVDYFSKDRDWKQHFLSLYNALHGTNLQVEDLVNGSAQPALSASHTIKSLDFLAEFERLPAADQNALVHLVHSLRK